MKRTAKKTPVEISGLFKLVLATLCLAGFVGFARFVSVGIEPGEKETAPAFSPEAPASYLNSSVAFDDCSSYLDGRGRRFGDFSSIESAVVTASHTAETEAETKIVNEASVDEAYVKEEFEGAPKFEGAFGDESLIAAEFVDDPEEESGELSPSGLERPVFGSESSTLASDFPSDDWTVDELKCDVKDYRSEWDKFDKERNAELAFDGADFVDQNYFKESLVTDDFFFSDATTALIGQTNAASGDSGQISQVSAETPAPKPKRWRGCVPRGAVGGFGVDEVQIR